MRRAHKQPLDAAQPKTDVTTIEGRPERKRAPGVDRGALVAQMAAPRPAPSGKVKKIVVHVVLDLDTAMPIPSKKAIAAHVDVALRRHDFHTRMIDVPSAGIVDLQTGLAVTGSRVRSIDID